MARRTRRTRPGRPPRRPLTLKKRLAFTGFTFALFVVVLEAGWQLAAWVTPDQVHIPEGAELEPPDLDAWRVMAVGDSWVYGAEAEPDQAFIEVFRRLVAEEIGRDVQLYNFGQSASNSSQAFMRVYDNVDYVQPHLVVALTGNNNLLHDTRVEDVARIMGEDIRLSGIRWLRWSKIYEGYRLWNIQRRASEPTEAITPDPVREILFGTGGADPGGRTALPSAPANPAAESPELEWTGRYYFRRDWANGLVWVQATDPVPPATEGAPSIEAQRGVLKAWEALFLAHLERFEEAETAAREALTLGSDDATAWEALAVSAELQDRSLHAIQHRIRAADATGYPWFSARARGLVLLDLEVWEAAEVWLMAAQQSRPQNLEVLLAFSRLPSATRAAVIEEILAEGPKGRVSQIEFYRWHDVSSGRVDRMVASLGGIDDGEPAAMTVARGDAAAVSEEPVAAEAFYRQALADPAARELDRARARAGLVRLASDAASFEALLGVPPDELSLDPSNAPAVIAFHSDQGDCDAAIRTGQAGLALGIAPVAFETAAGPCLTRELGWSLAEQALGHGPVLDRAALVLGITAGSRASSIPAPDVPFWDAYRERRFDEVAAQATGAWKGLALAHLGRHAEALAELDAAEAASDDAAVIAYGRHIVAFDEGDFVDAFLQAAVAAHSDGDPWVKTLASGIALSGAMKWKGCQVDLLTALRVAPGYLEALEALAMVPQPLRYPAAENALRYVPSGNVSADRWSAWYLAQERFEEARRALDWPPGFLPEDPSSRARRAIARGRIAEADGQPEVARSAYGEAMREAEALESRVLFCRAAARRVWVAGNASDVAEDELVVLTGACADHPEAIATVGQVAAWRGSCDKVETFSRRALEAGADPSDVADWMEPCASAEIVDEWLPLRTEGYPVAAGTWLTHRVRPGTEDELPPADAPIDLDLLTRQLAAMRDLSREAGSEFVALTYPFPSTHQQGVRDKLVAQGPLVELPILDLYGHFEATYSAEEWRAMRTPQDHVNADGYTEMGRQLFGYVRAEGHLP